LKAKPDRHGPNRFSSYQEIHRTVLDQFKSRDFIGTETLEFTPFPNGFLLKGEISCLGEIVIAVEKFLDIHDLLPQPIDDFVVQTTWYSYNAFVRNHSNILRYDNQDGDDLRPGHADAHHKHSFDWLTGKEEPGSPFWVGSEGWLTLGEVIQEVEDWYWANRKDLPHPDAYPNLNLRGCPPSLEKPLA